MPRVQVWISFATLSKFNEKLCWDWLAMPATGMGGRAVGGMPSVNHSRCWPKPSPCAHGKMKAQRGKQDVLRVTRQSQSGLLILPPRCLAEPWSMSFHPVEKSHYFSITSPSLFSGRELIDLNFSRIILPPPLLPWAPNCITALPLGNE